MSTGKSTATGVGNAAGAPQFVSLDQLAALLQAMNRPPPKEEKTSEDARTDRAIALANALSKYQKLGKDIEPQLAEDGVNWPDWDAAITAIITRVFEFKRYLVTANLDPSRDRAILTGVLIEHSIHPTLVALVHGKTGRAAFHILQNQFASVSWTYAMSRWLKASNPSNISLDLNTAYLEMTTCLTEIKKHVGGITKDLALALLLHQRCQPHFQAIANALDAHIAVDASKPINSKTILELAGRLATAGVAADLLVFAYWAKRGPGGPTAGTSSGAMGEERKLLEDMEVWVEDVPPSDRWKILRAQWLLGTKQDMDGKIKRRKARIIVGGHWQENNFNYNETFAPTPTFASLQTALTVAEKLGWSVASFDVKTTFLHSPINEDVWVVPPPGHIVLPGKVWKLKKALYGTKQAGRCWWLHLKTTLEQLEFTANPQDQSTYTYQKDDGVAFL
ncbi:hypothetical protein PCANC_05580 [Puccinia coronata f. sp. avenae]|uniref:Reverse transcriptase Ty1/copia-type domain-containing protein n=1 Tax=Puccinia coronata f. sp. avenae TaxID=200324 RepID=A0A2N5VPA5_9BASI|nr:hypothetical protein PCANC_05580 [Puccinia coronata f. sp. avenae]